MKTRGVIHCIPHCTLRGKNGPLAFEIEKTTSEPKIDQHIFVGCFMGDF